MDNKQEVTYYRFLSEIKAFLAKLLSNPIKAEPSKYLSDLGFTRSRIINLLIKKDILERNEKILTPDKTGAKKVKYSVTFKVKKKNFDRTMRRIYARYFEKNLPEKQTVNEWTDTSSCGMILGSKTVFGNEDKMKQDMLRDKRDREAYLTRGGMKGIEELEECDIAGATTCGASSGQFVQPLGVVNKPLLQKRKKDKDYTDPTEILGKEISEEKKKKVMAKNIYLTESQLKYILKEEALGGATTAFSVADTTRGPGDIGYDTPAFGKSKNTRKNKKEKGTDSDFFKPAMEREPGFSCKRVGDKK